MTMQAYPVQIDQGKIRSTDGSPLPEHAYAVLVVLPEPAPPLPGEDLPVEEWQKPFEAFFAVLQKHPSRETLDVLSDDQLNQLVHTARTD